MYQIRVHPNRELISVKLGGMMSVAEVDRYIAELKVTFRDRRIEAGYLLLIDVSDCTIQSQNMIEAMRAHMATFPKAKRIAMVAGSSLARMQVKRLMTQAYAQVFAGATEAMQWLVTGPAAETEAPVADVA